MDQTAHDCGVGLGALVHKRKHTGLGHTVGAVFIFLAPMIFVSTVVVFVKQNPGVKPMSVSEKLGIVAFVAALAGGGGLVLFIKGRKERKEVETYEYGIRLKQPSGKEVVFKYTDVRQLKRRTLNGALVAIVFVLNAEESYEIGVHGKEDVQVLNYILDRYGPVSWERDNSFRIM